MMVYVLMVYQEVKIVWCIWQFWKWRGGCCSVLELVVLVYFLVCVGIVGECLFLLRFFVMDVMLVELDVDGVFFEIIMIMEVVVVVFEDVVYGCFDMSRGVFIDLLD